MEGESKSQWRDAPPIHFRFRIESFSRLSSSWTKRYESGVFKVGSYNWKLAIYPNGNTLRGGEDHISVYLVLAPNSHTKLKKEILVSFTLLLFDQVRERYLPGQDISRLDKQKTELGFDKFLPLKSFIDPLNGFLVNDTCMFGADISVMENTPKQMCLSMMPSKTAPYKHTWRVKNFSAIKGKYCSSEKFTTRGHQWKLVLYPKGHGIGKDTSLALFLELANSGTLLSDGGQVLVECTFRLVDQVNNNHKTRTLTTSFCAPNKMKGCSTFLPFSDFNRLTAGYLVGNSCIIEAEVTVLGSAKDIRLADSFVV